MIQANCRHPERRGGALASRKKAFAAALLLTLVCSAAHDPASALPAFARQTGQPCASCHTALPQLTPFGRRFKLGGYTMQGGDQFRELPQLSVLLQPTFTHNATPLSAIPSPNGGFTNTNNWLDLPQQASLFYAGRVYGNLGAFIQLSYDNDYGRVFHWDNADVRYVDTIKVGAFDVTYGLDTNNSPTVQDPWNTTPVWSFPFIDSPFQAGQAPAPTMIENLGQTVLGAGGYVFINDMLYAEVQGYGSLTPRVQTDLGVSPPSLTFTINGIAPYYRLALEPVWGDFSWEIGTYGMAANILPNRVYGFGTDKIFDAGFDSQFQWIGDMHNVTLRANYIFERQILDSTYAQGYSANPVDYLRNLRISAEYVYDHTYAINVAWFQLRGTPDAFVYSTYQNLVPNTQGWVVDVSYLPFSHGSPGPWPFFNMRIGLAYTNFSQLNGSNNYSAAYGYPNARDSNSLVAYSYIVF